MQVATLFLLGTVLAVFPGVADAQSSAPRDSAASDNRGPCMPELPDPNFTVSPEALATRERSIKEGSREVDLDWRTPEEDAAWSYSMPMWMRKISKRILDRVLLLKDKDLLVDGRRHIAAQYSSEPVPVDSLARLMVSCKVKTSYLFDERFFASIGGHLVRSVRDPGHPNSSMAFLDAWVPPEYIRCLAENPEVFWVKDLGVSNKSTRISP